MTEPPGELMYSQMSLESSSPSRYSSWAEMRLAIWSLTSEPRITIRFFSRRWKTSLVGSGMPDVCPTISGNIGGVVICGDMDLLVRSVWNGRAGYRARHGLPHRHPGGTAVA